MDTTLRIVDFARSAHQLSFVCAIGEHRFATSIWYDDVDLVELEDRFGADLLRRVYFHAVAFESMKLCSLAPDAFDLGPFADQHTPELEALWREVLVNVWGQWRYENDRPSYDGPAFVGHDGAATPGAGAVDAGPVEVLAFCGGGKDSLLSLRLLEHAGVPYSTLQYSSSVYGRADLQHELIGALLDHCGPTARHRQWVYDDFLDAPVTDLAREFGVATITAAETPASIFAALPYALAHGYTYLCLAHEKSADRGNLVWDATGEEINHQWGKSAEAEQLINRYLGDHLLANVQYFSILKPIHDPLIFSMLTHDLDAFAATHSCNVKKPWCKRCPKCAYVWLNAQAYLPPEVVDVMFGENLFDLPENLLSFRQMLGLEAHTPFECIGQVDEVRLAFELCHRRGRCGTAMDVYLREARLTDPAPAVETYCSVDHRTCIPHPARQRMLSQMDTAADLARERITTALR